MERINWRVKTSFTTMTERISFVLDRVADKDVLDIGCVMHNPENYKSGYWLHKAIR